MAIFHFINKKNSLDFDLKQHVLHQAALVLLVPFFILNKR